MTHTSDTKDASGTASFKSVAQIFDGDDPSPEESRDLSDRAEDRIFHAVLAVPKTVRAGLSGDLTIRVPTQELTPGRQDAIISATRLHFQRRAGEVQQDMKLIQRVGLREIRLTVAVCIPSFAGIAVCSQFKGDALAEVVENILVIFCWVTIWQPFQSLVFDRWTQSETAKVYQKIAGMPIRVLPVE
jgi:hypothetical protein